MEKFKFYLVVTFVISLLTACGGGGGSSRVSCTIPINSVAITSTNAETIASEVVSAIQTILALANVNSAFIEFLDEDIIDNPATVACDISGFITVTITDRDRSGTITVGDFISANFSSCALITGTVSGGIQGTINNAVGTDVGSVSSANDWVFNISGDFINLRINDNNISIRINGDGAVNVAFTFATLQLDSTTTTTMATFTTNNDQCGSIQNSDITSLAENATTNPVAYTATVNPAGAMTVASSAFGGAVTAQTTTEFGGIENLDDSGDGAIDEYFVELDSPDSGVLKIIGLMSTATVNIVANNMVRIDVDENGDEITDQVINTTWDAL